MERHRGVPCYTNAWLYDPHSPLHPTPEMLVDYDDLTPRWGRRYGSLQIRYSVLTYIDKQVGGILDLLDELGLGETTFVLFSSDNGPGSGLIGGVDWMPTVGQLAGVVVPLNIRGEMDDLASRRPNIVQRLSRQLLDWHKTLPPGPVAPGAGEAHYPWPESRE